MADCAGGRQGQEAGPAAAAEGRGRAGAVAASAAAAGADAVVRFPQHLQHRVPRHRNHLRVRQLNTSTPSKHLTPPSILCLSVVYARHGVNFLLILPERQLLPFAFRQN